MNEDLELAKLGVDQAQLKALSEKLEAAQHTEVQQPTGPPEPVTFMGMTMGALMAGLFFSTLGIGYIRYGKAVGAFMFPVFGLVLLIVPFFVTSTLPLVVLGATLALLPIGLKRFVAF